MVRDAISVLNVSSADDDDGFKRGSPAGLGFTRSFVSPTDALLSRDSQCSATQRKNWLLA